MKALALGEWLWRKGWREGMRFLKLDTFTIKPAKASLPTLPTVALTRPHNATSQCMTERQKCIPTVAYLCVFDPPAVKILY